MEKCMNKYASGQFVFSKTGRDKGNIYVVMNFDGNFVYLSDGKLHKIDKTKKKNIKHVQYISHMDEDLKTKIQNKTITNENLKLAIKNYKLAKQS